MKASDQVIQEYFSALLDDSAPVEQKNNIQLTEQRQAVKLHAKPSVTPKVEPVLNAQSHMKASQVKPARTVSSVAQEAKPELTKVATAPLQKLLDGVTQLSPIAEITNTPPKEKLESDLASNFEVEVELQVEVELAPQTEAKKSCLETQPEPPEEEFQVLYFEVAGMTLAVPLEQLGGIYNVSEDSVNSLFGKPGWFKGLMPYRERQLNVVDTALWVMPEKYDEELAEKLNYQYLVMLKDSDWGLACEKLVTTSQLEPVSVNWRQTMGKRPWLRGMVKEKMCALLNVDALIELLDTGLNSQNI